MAKSVGVMERLWLTAVLVIVLIGSPAKQPQNGLAYAAMRGDADSFVETYYVERDCVPGKKNVRNLKTGAARFILDERQPGVIERLKTDIRPYMCHYELETPSGYGFHVYIDEMYLEDNPNYNSQVEDKPCTDYVQFGRDTLYVTTFKSPYFCGKRSRKATVNSNGTSVFTGGQGMRMYTEVVDHEMDVWLRLSPRSAEEAASKSPRLIYMTVTTIKKGCGQKDAFYRQCRHTSNCIRREFFCDGRVNCAWPDAEAGGTDEVDCDKEGERYKGPFNSMGAQNIPLIIVVIIVAVALLVIAAVIGKRFFTAFCDKIEGGSSDSRTTRPQSRDRRLNSSQTLEFEAVNSPASEVDEATPALRPETGGTGSDLPTAPPSYEEVIKDANPVILSTPTAPPPPYTPPEQNGDGGGGQAGSSTTTAV